MAALSSIVSFLAHSIRLKTAKYSTLQLNGASSAEKFYNLLQKNGCNIEKTLPTIKAKLDSRCVSEVMQRCSLGLSQMGLRFFIWSGLQPNYRHSSFMYSRACELFGINRSPSIIIDVIEDYRKEGCLVDIRTFKVVLNLCKEAKLANEALWVLRKIPEFNMRADTTVYNVVLRLFAEKGEMEKALELMKQMGLVDLYPDMITYVAMTKGFCDLGRLEDACGLFKAMKNHGCTPNAVAYSALLDGFCRFGSMEKAIDLLVEMEKEGEICSPTVVTYTSVIQRLCEKGQSLEALKILDRMEASGCAPNRITVSTLIKSFCAEGHWPEEVYKLIDRAVRGGGVSYGDCYSSLVVSLVRINRLGEANELFNQMLVNGVKPDSVACNVIVKELILKGEVVGGFLLCDEIEKNGYLSSIDSETCSLLLVGLCEQKHSVETAKLARMMLKNRIRLGPSNVDNIIEHLKRIGDDELVMQLNIIQR